MLSLYDSLSRSKVPVVPLSGERVRLYTCGPTVYRYVHVGNLRTYLLTDLAVRALRFAGLPTYSVLNITDMGHMHQEQLEQGQDKVIAAARAAGKTAREIAAHFTDAFLRDCGRMNFLPADLYPRASEHVPEMIGLARELERRGKTYADRGYLYLDVTKVDGYGELSGARLGRGEAAERTGEEVHRHKRRPEDFTLWLPAEEDREFRWESPWGPGWPGWHVECAAMSVKYLGPDFEIHVGGSDLRFPHHENSRAMAMGATGGGFARIWLHGAHLLVSGKKMSKSARNEYTLDHLADRGVSPAEFRFHCLSHHYRTPMNFTWEGQQGSAVALGRLRAAFRKAQGQEPGGPRGAAEAAQESRRRFREAVEDDLNLPRALAVVHEAARAGLPPGLLRELGREWDGVLGVGLLEEAEIPAATAAEAEAVPEEVARLVREREAARGEKRYADADRLRERIRALGYEVTDRKGKPPGISRREGGGT